MKFLDMFRKRVKSTMLLIKIEGMVFDLARKLTNGAYSGGGWDNFEVAPNVFIMVPSSVDSSHPSGLIEVGGLPNGNSELVNRVTLGAIVCVHALNQMLWAEHERQGETPDVIGLHDTWMALHDAILDYEGDDIDVSAYAYILD